MAWTNPTLRTIQTTSPQSLLTQRLLEHLFPRQQTSIVESSPHSSTLCPREPSLQQVLRHILCKQVTQAKLRRGTAAAKAAVVVKEEGYPTVKQEYVSNNPERLLIPLLLPL